MDTSGFYKFDTSLLYGPTLVVSADFELYRDQKDTYNYPINGWYWFDSDSDARSFFGLPTHELYLAPGEVLSVSGTATGNMASNISLNWSEDI